MSMLSRMLMSAGLSGIVAALLLSLVQFQWVTPLILAAETYEIAAESTEHVHAAETAFGHEHAEDAWQPEEGWQRTLATISSNILMAIGFASMLVGAYQLRRPSRWTSGLSWGIAGFTVFFVMPSLGLPPELPGTVAADLLARQYWWLGTVCATSIGLGLLFLQGHKVLKIVGVLLLLSPHLIGAPQPAMAESLAPEALQVRFIQASVLSNLLFWLVLGGLSAALAIRFDRTDLTHTRSSPEDSHG
ncbi:CbtA family protein [Methylomonas montana]|uniref:CbtA family protein n=1 Tax=Methylomonas montana TaxID=3058963 RepID=UPI00265B3E59|nr:CbtA family protein [Methylomonas montana]WKJ91962.1 CbtA family protein [Methylomonas montana]